MLNRLTMNRLRINKSAMEARVTMSVGRDQTRSTATKRGITLIALLAVVSNAPNWNRLAVHSTVRIVP